MITILTHSPKLFSQERIKSAVKKILGKQRGPLAVVKSLDRGLTELNIPHNIDPHVKNYYPTVHVVAGIGALRHAIELKKKGVIKKLIAGPNIVVLPSEFDNIIQDKNIDIILQPSQWTKDLFLSYNPQLADKIHLWPAGVQNSTSFSSRNNNHGIIYQKNAPESVLEETMRHLIERNIRYTILRYGSFNQNDYYNLLNTSDFLVYLSRSESQGIALQEAWVRDVPTLVWTDTVWKYGNTTWTDPKISAPYLTAETGEFFHDKNSFHDTIDRVIHSKGSYSPRTYALERFTDKVCAKHYIDILSNTQS